MLPRIIPPARYCVEGYVSGYDRSGEGTGVHNLRLLGFPEFKVFWSPARMTWNGELPSNWFIRTERVLWKEVQDGNAQTASYSSLKWFRVGGVCY